VRASAALSYLPYPVIAGFLAMIGAAVCQGALGILRPGEGQSGLPMVIGVTMACVSIGLKHYGVPTNFSSVLLIVFSLVLFHGWAFAAGRSLADLQRDGWLLPAGAGFAGPLDIWRVDWAAADLRQAFPDVHAIALIFVACINRALTVSAIESVAAAAPYSTNSEMQRLGLATVGVGLLGGVAMNPVAGMTTLCKEGSRDDPVVSRCASALISAGCLLIWVSGCRLTAYLPKFLLGGLLMVMGGGMLVDWAWLVKRRLQWTGVAVIYGMLLVSIHEGLTSGIGLGVVLALVLTNVRFAQLQVLQYHVSGTHFRSAEMHTDEQRAVLRQYGYKTQVVGLTGFLFEGVAISLCKYLKEVIRTLPDLETLVLDCFACQGINDSACSHLVKVARLCEARCVSLVLCNLSPGDERLLRSWHVESEFCCMEDNLTSALAKAERSLLERCAEPQNPPLPRSEDGRPEREALAEWLGAEAADELLAAAKLTTVPAGTMLSAQGQHASRIFVAVPGHSDVELELQTGSSHRPAVLHRTTLGAVCAPEGLLQCQCRGTWRAHGDSVGLVLEPPSRCAQLQHALAPLLAAGLSQQFHEMDQLSGRYTVSRGGGWHGVTFDASTKVGAPARMESTGGIANAGAAQPPRWGRPTPEEEEDGGSSEGTPSLDRAASEGWDWNPSEISVAAVLQRSNSGTLRLPVAGQGARAGRQGLDSLLLNRLTVSDVAAVGTGVGAGVGRSRSKSANGPGLADLFSDEPASEPAVEPERPAPAPAAAEGLEALREPLVAPAEGGPCPPGGAPRPDTPRTRTLLDSLKSTTLARALLTGEQNPADQALELPRERCLSKSSVA